MIWLNIRQIEAPQGSTRSTPKPMIRRVNTSITTMTQWLRRSIDSQRNKSTLHRLSFICPIKLSQDGPSVPVSGSFRDDLARDDRCGARGKAIPRSWDDTHVDLGANEGVRHRAI